MSPEDSEKNVALNTLVTVTFNKTVVNVDGANFFLERLGSFGTIPANVTYNDTTKTATLTPEADLDWDTIYVVSLTDDVRSRAGIPLPATTWVFTTGREGDSIPPSITSKSPTQTNYVPINTAIYAQFSEAVIPATVNTSSFFIRNEDTASVLAATVDYDANLFRATLNVIYGNLDEWTNYTVYALDTITDTAGNSLPLTQWSFKTDDTNDPIIIDRSPLPDATDVPTNQTVSVVFSESLRSSTIHNNSINFKLQEETAPDIWEDAVYTVIYTNTTKTAILYPADAMSENTRYKVILSSNITDLALNGLNDATMSWIFTTTNTPDITEPTIVSTDPLSGAIGIQPDTNVSVEFDENVTGVGASSFIVERVSDSAAVAGNIIYNSSTRTTTFTPVNLLSEGTQYRVRLTAAIKDTANNALVPVSFIFTTADNTKPILASHFPSSGAGNVAVNINITATFSEDVTGVDAASFTVYNETDALYVSGAVTYSAATKTATFTPDAPFDYSSEFTVTLTNAIKDASNNTLNQVIWNFYTGDEPDTTAPTVSSRYPAINATDIPRSAAVTVTFSEPVTGVGDANITLKKGDVNGTVIASQVTFNAVTDTATLLPGNYLDNSEQYTVIVDGGVSTDIKDMAGNKLADNITWSFTTVADITAPTITYRTPEQGTPDVPGNAVSVTVVFSERVQFVDNTTFKLIRVADSADIASNVSYTYNPSTNTASATLVPLADITTTGTYRVQLSSGIKDISVNQNSLALTEWTFEITALDLTVPTVLSRNPGQGALNWIDGRVQVVFSEDVTGVSASSFYVKDSSNTTVPAVVSYSTGLLTAELELTSGIVYEETYTAYLTSAIKDLANNQLSPVSWTFSSPADIVPPSVTNVYPADNTSAYPVSGLISATFSEGIAGYNASTFYLDPAASTNITYDPDTKTLTMTPTSNLQGSTTYTVHVTTDITDQADIPNALASEYTWSFTTQAVPDTTPPAVVDGTRSPGPGSSGIAMDTNVSIQFSENVVNATSKIKLYKGGTQVQANVTYNPATFYATLDPQEELEQSTLYTVLVKGGPTGIQDASGNYLAADDTWTFTTVADSVAPTISSRYPVPGATNIPLKPVVTVTFSEPVTGVSGSSFYLTGSGVPTCYVVYDEPTRTATLTPGSNLSNSTTYTVNLTNSILDRANNALANTAWTFTTNSLPVITDIAYSTGGAYTTVADGTTTVSYNTNGIRITFNRSMNTAKQWMEIFEGASGASPASPGQWTWTGDTVVTYSITGRFKGGTAYQAKLYGWGGSFEDTDGNTVSTSAYVGDGIFNFTTTADGVAPAKISTIPANGATNVGRDTGIIVIRFNEMMNQGNGSISLSPNPGAASGRTWLDSGRTVKFTIPQLAASTSYTVTLSSFRDVANNNEGGSTFSFSTGSTTGSTIIESDSFDTYTEPDYLIFENLSGDNWDWIRLSTEEAGNGTSLSPQNGAYFTEGASWQGNFDEYADMDYITQVDHSLAGTYILTFMMPHERLYNAVDRLKVYISTNGTDFTQITAGALTDVLRYDWSLGSDAPVWQMHYVDLSPYSGIGYGNLWLRFRGISAGETGGNVIIDDLRVTRY